MLTLELAGNTTRTNAGPQTAETPPRRQLSENHPIPNSTTMKRSFNMKKYVTKASQKLHR